MFTENPRKPIWMLSAEEALLSLNSSRNGLTTAEAQKRLKQNGQNQIARERQRPAMAILWSQFQNWLVITLLVATAIAFFLGERLDSAVIFIMLLASFGLGFQQEYKAERALFKLKKFLNHKALALRDSKWQEIDSQKLVIGDVVALHLGDKVPADLRLIEVEDIFLDEAILTGESLPVLKKTASLEKVSLQIFERQNMGLAGTFCVGGSARGVVTAIGQDTVLGQTVKTLRESAPLTDFQKQTKNFGLFIFRVILILAFFVFLTNTFLGRSPLDSLLFALALTVGIAPELLPVITTITLAQGALLMAKKRVIVKRLAAVEDLGNIDTLCTDKTGTLTEGKIHLESFVNLDNKSDPQILLLGLLCSEGFSQPGHRKLNNPVDLALWADEKSLGLKKTLTDFKLLESRNFDFETKKAAVLVEKDGTYQLIVKGAPENILPGCSKWQKEGRTEAFGKDGQKKITETILDFEKNGTRVLALAQRETKNIKDEGGLTLMGYLLFSDPLKKNVNESLRLFKNLGIAVKILSGDSPAIVQRVANLAMLYSDQEKVIVGSELLGLDKKTLAQYAQKYHLFARLTPLQKYQLVLSLNQEGHIVGFLGDGVNDAPALKAADVGISVNTGADVTKEEADVVLLEKDLKVLGDGILAGRKTFGNIIKYILNTMSANLGNMSTVALSSIFLKFLPLLPSQILLTNLLSDIPLLTVATDNVDREFTLKPKHWNINFISRFMLIFGLLSSLFDLLLIIPLQFIFKVDPAVFRTAWFLESVISEIIITFVIRTKMIFFKSRPSNLLIISSLISIFAVVLLPFFWGTQILFSFVNLPLAIWVWIGIILLAYFATAEFVKKWFYRRFNF